jgi:superfamily II DNA or RNA helicase
MFLKTKKTVHAVISNRWTVFKCPPERIKNLKKIFRYPIPGAEFSQSYRNGSWDGCKNMLLRGRVSTGLFLELKSELEKKYLLTIEDQCIFPQFLKKKSESDRDYQNEALEAMRTNSSCGGLLIAATGAGKTRMAAEFFKSLVGRGLFVVDELTLLEQTRLEFEEVIGEKIGIAGRSIFDPQRITVATIQTLSKHCKRKDFVKWYKTIEVVMIDEIHVAINRRNINIISQIKPKAVFGLTATLQLQKPEVRFPVTALTGPVIFDYAIKTGVEEGFLTQGTVVNLQFQDPMKKPVPGYFTVVGKDKKKKWIPPWERLAIYRHHISLNKARNDMIESLVREGLKRKRRIVVLVEQRRHLKILTSRFKDVNHRVLSGDKNLSGDPSLRVKAMKDMDAGKVPLILASRVMSKGSNVKSVNVIIDGTALPGDNSAIQRYGRGVRKVDGKHGLLYINISDCGNKLAYASKLREAALLKTNAHFIHMVWRGDPKEVYELFERKKGSPRDPRTHC